MKRLGVVLLILLACSTAAVAVIRPTMIRLDFGESYLIPAGKALVINSIITHDPEEGGGFPGEEQIRIRLQITQGVETLELGEYQLTGDDPPWPLVLGEGTELVAVGDTNGWWAFFTLLVDQADLYAQVDHGISDIHGVEGGALAFALKTHTASPFRFAVESSEDLTSGWLPEPTAAIIPTPDKTEYVVTAPVSESSKNFRTKAFRRRR